MKIMEVYHNLCLCLKQPLKHSGGILGLVFVVGLSVGLVLLLAGGGVGWFGCWGFK